MKSLGKLNINSEKMLKNEELVNLKGGYDALLCCYSWEGFLGYVNASTGTGPGEGFFACYNSYPSTRYCNQC